MAKDKSITKKDIQQLLDGQTKVILHAVDKKIGGKIDELAVMVHNSFQSNQEYMDKRFDVIGEDMRHVHYTLDKIDKRFEGQEKIIFNHDGRIDKLEVDAKVVKKALAI